MVLKSASLTLHTIVFSLLAVAAKYKQRARLTRARHLAASAASSRAGPAVVWRHLAAARRTTPFHHVDGMFGGSGWLRLAPTQKRERENECRSPSQPHCSLAGGQLLVEIVDRKARPDVQTNHNSKYRHRTRSTHEKRAQDTRALCTQNKLCICG